MIALARFTSAAVLGLVLSVQGNELIIESKILNARNLAGQILDLTGAPISGAQVQLISCRELRNVNAGALSIVKTDERGLFVFPQQPKQKLYCLQVVSAGFDLFRVAVNLYPEARDMKLTLTAGT